MSEMRVSPTTVATVARSYNQRSPLETGQTWTTLQTRTRETRVYLAVSTWIATAAENAPPSSLVEAVMRSKQFKRTLLHLSENARRKYRIRHTKHVQMGADPTQTTGMREVQEFSTSQKSPNVYTHSFSVAHYAKKTAVRMHSDH